MKDQEAEVFFQLCGLIKFRNDTYKLFDEISSSLRFTRLEIDFGIEPESLFFSQYKYWWRIARLEFTNLTRELVIRQVNMDEFCEVGQEIRNSTFKTVVIEVNKSEILQI